MVRSERCNSLFQMCVLLQSLNSSGSLLGWTHVCALNISQHVFAEHVEQSQS